METDELVAIVTGGAQGIGRCITTYLLSEGYRVFIFDINSDIGMKTEEDLKQIYGEEKVSFLHCDVADKDSFTDIFNQTVKFCGGHISLMVNNAGIANEHNYQQCIGVNLIGAITGCNLAIDNMRKDKKGKGGIIVNIASMAAVDAYYSLPTYCATKSGVVNFTRSWAKNPKCDELGLTFLCLCPGFADTALVRDGAVKTLDPVAFEAAKKYGMLQLDSIDQAFQKLLTDCKNGSILEVSVNRTEYIRSPFRAT